MVLIGDRELAAGYRRRITAWGADVAIASSADAVRMVLSEARQRHAFLLLGPCEALPVPQLRAEWAARFPAEPLGAVMIGGAAAADAGACLAVLPWQAEDRLLHASLHAALAVPDGPAGEAPGRAAAARAVWPRRRILVAEDNRINQLVIMKMLERAGHEVDLVGNGEEALDALVDRQFDLVIIDLNMPVMGGLDAVKMHRFATGGRDVPPFIALTADATDETRRQCEAAGIEGYLAKPVDIDELLPMIDRLTRPASAALPMVRLERVEAPGPAAAALYPRSTGCCSSGCASSTTRTASSARSSTTSSSTPSS